MEYRLSSAARCDLQDISRYIGKKNPSAAERILDQIFDKFVLLQEHPKLGPPRDDLLEGMRHSVVGKHVIYYRAANEGIEILRVVHGSRDINKIQFD